MKKKKKFSTEVDGKELTCYIDLDEPDTAICMMETDSGEILEGHFKVIDMGDSIKTVPLSRIHAKNPEDITKMLYHVARNLPFFQKMAQYSKEYEKKENENR